MWWCDWRRWIVKSGPLTGRQRSPKFFLVRFLTIVAIKRTIQWRQPSERLQQRQITDPIAGSCSLAILVISFKDIENVWIVIGFFFLFRDGCDRIMSGSLPAACFLMKRHSVDNDSNNCLLPMDLLNLD